MNTAQVIEEQLEKVSPEELAAICAGLNELEWWFLDEISERPSKRGYNFLVRIGRYYRLLPSESVNVIDKLRGLNLIEQSPQLTPLGLLVYSQREMFLA